MRRFELEKGLEHDVKDCVNTKRGRLENGSDVYCLFTRLPCPYQVENKKYLKLCGLARPTYMEKK